MNREREEKGCVDRCKQQERERERERGGGRKRKEIKYLDRQEH